MSWHCLQEQEEDFSLQDYLDGLPSAQSKLGNTREKSCTNGNTMGILNDSPYGTMYAPSTEFLGGDMLMSSRGDFLAKTLVQHVLITVDEPTGLMGRSLAYGKSINASLQKYNLRMCLPKTQHTYVVKDLSKCSKTLTAWGMMQDGEYCLLGTLGRITKGKECGLLPTPTTMANQLAPSMTKHKGCVELHRFLESMPTPTAHNAKEGGYPAEGTRNTPTLGWVVGGKISPTLTEWMMGWPIGWTDLKPLGMGKCQLVQPWHGLYFLAKTMFDWLAEHGIVLETITKGASKNEPERKK